MKTIQKKNDVSHILVIDDDKRIRELVSRYLHHNDFIVMSAKNTQHAKEIMHNFEFDGLVVDVMMPEQNGMDFVRELRQAGYDKPAILLTALNEVEDRISGLQSGADDYLAKPFEPMELVLRLRAILKRTKDKKAQHKNILIGRWCFNPDHDELTSGEEIISLTAVEANLLRALSSSIDNVLSREDLAKKCALESGERTIDVQVTRLRRKIEENTKQPRYLQTIRGKGYILRAERA